MLIGRDPEQRLIARLVAGARVGHSGVLVLVGEAGIGKTALLDSAAAQAESMSVLRVSGDPAETGIAFGALLQMLRPALGLVSALPAPQARALEVALALRDGEVGDRFAIGAAALSLLSRFGEDRPVLVLVDDAHDIDQPSAEAIVFAARRLLADRVAVLMAIRPTGAGPVAESGLPEHQVDGLDLPSSSQLVASTTSISRDQTTRLHRASGGNPLALLELAKDAGTLEPVSRHMPLPVPEAVARAFTRRLDELSAEALTVLLVGAVADGDLGVAAGACAGLGADLGRLAEAEKADLVRLSAGQATFRHPLVRSAVYAAADPDLRRRVHRAVAEALPARDVERRAWNLAEATVGLDGSVADLLDQVGQRGRQRGAYADAAAAFERAGLLSPGGSDLAMGRFSAAGECAWLAGQAGRATDLLDRVLALGPARPLLTRVRELKATVAARTGSLPVARALLLEAADEESSYPDTAVVLLADAVRISLFSADSGGGSETVDRLERLLPMVTTARARTLGNLAVGVGRTLAGTGGVENLRAAVADFVRLPASDEDPARADWLLVGPLFLRESGTGRELVQRAIEERRKDAALGALPLLLFHLARDDATTDRWSAAEIGYQEGVVLARESGQSTDLAMCLAGLAWLMARMGREEACREAAGEAGLICRRHGVHLGTAWVASALAELELGLGDAEQAAASLEALTELLADLGVQDVDLSPAPELVESLVRTGEIERARAVSEAFQQQAEGKRQPWALARAERARGTAAPAGEADEHFKRALELHRDTNDLFERARTELAYGSRLRRERRSADSRHQLGSALRAFERLGARPWADQCAVELAAAGGSASRRGAGPSDVLTPQEHQIAVMLGVEGRTTKQAAAALFLSPKTVEYHLRHVYTKLAVASRDDLRRVLTRGDED